MSSMRLLLCVSLCAFWIRRAAARDRPIIGVLTQPMPPPPLGQRDAGSRDAIVASYVKFVESAGGRVVPIHYVAPNDELTSLFNQINGLLLPGGGADIVTDSKFTRASNLLLDLAIKANDGGDAFPIHGTCMGFQQLMTMVAKDYEVLCRGCFETEGTPLPLEVTPLAWTSHLFSDLPPALKTALTHENITENSHVDGVMPDAYESNANLQEFFNILSVNTDPMNGKKFISSVEAKKYPIFAVQWHPEKNNFEWGKIGRSGYKAIPHSASAIQLSQYMANNFVNSARLSSHTFASNEAEDAALIYNWAPVRGPIGYFEQVYVWNRTQATGAGGSIIV